MGKKVELNEDSLNDVSGGGLSDQLGSLARNAVEKSASDATKKSATESKANIYNNDNRGGKQMNSQMGKNYNDSKGNAI